MHNVFHLSQLCPLLDNMPPNSVECRVIFNQKLYSYENCIYYISHDSMVKHGIIQILMTNMRVPQKISSCKLHHASITFLQVFIIFLYMICMFIAAEFVVDLQIFNDTRYVAWDLNGVMLDIVGWYLVRHKIRNFFLRKIDT